MKSNRSMALLLVSGFGAVLMGCGDDGGPDASVAEIEEMHLHVLGGGNPGSDPPPVGGNHDDVLVFWRDDTQAALRILGNTSVDTMPSMNGLPADSRRIIATAMQCALNYKQVAYGDLGEPYPGWWGLAPKWTIRPLEPQERRWVTACMLQKLNATHWYVPILLEGEIAPIAHDSQWDQRFGYTEATVFGDLFSSTTPLGQRLPPFNAYVCEEDDLITLCGNDDPSYAMMLRICDTSDQCGFTHLGACRDKGVNSNGYWYFPATPEHDEYHETIRVKLEPNDASCAVTVR